jgi:hypothetical protein
MKSFYSCIDAFLSAPQPEQHLVIREKAKKEGGGITFYGAEEYRSAPVQSFILPKLKRTAGLDGVVFFTLNQFRYADKLNVKLMREILDLGMEMHFAREDISLRSRDELERWLAFLLVVDFTKRRDASGEWREIVAKS